MTLKWKFAIIIGLCTSLSVAAYFIINNSGRSAGRVSRTTIVTMDGVRLPSVLEGSVPNARYDLKQIASHATPAIRCTSGGRMAWVDRIKEFFEPSVFPKVAASHSIRRTKLHARPDKMLLPGASPILEIRPRALILAEISCKTTI